MQFLYVEGRHFNGMSDVIGTGDQLMRLTENGWHIATIARHKQGKAGRWFVTYIVELQHKSEMTVMVVVQNPFMERLYESIRREQAKAERLIQPADLPEVELELISA